LKSYNVSLKNNGIGERSLAKSKKHALPSIKKTTKHKIESFKAHDEFIKSGGFPTGRLEEAMEKILGINTGRHKKKDEFDISHDGKSEYNLS